jgi:hypothetical protein
MTCNHLNSIMQPSTKTRCPWSASAYVGVRFLVRDRRDHIYDDEMATRFCVEVAKCSRAMSVL